MIYPTTPRSLISKRPSERSLLESFSIVPLAEALAFPIDRFPNEILRIILCFVASPTRQPPGVDINEARTVRRRFISINQVCTLWRKISIATPEIWSRCFDIGLREDAINTILRFARIPDKRTVRFVIPRSNMDHRLNTRDPEPVWPSAMDRFEESENEELLNDVLVKSSEVDAALSIDDGQFLAWPRMRESLPYFERLKLTLYDTTPGVAGLQFQDGNHTSLYPLTPNAPHPWNLRSLELSRCIFRLDPTFLSNLEELSISGIVGIPDIHMSPMAWISVLKSLPKLQSLTLIHALTDSSGNVDLRVDGPTCEGSYPGLSRMRQTIIPNLRNILVVSSFKEYQREFLYRLRVPLSCVVKAYSN